MSVSVSIDPRAAEAIARLVTRLDDVPKRLRPGVRRAIQKSGSVLQRRAQASASWSRRIPGSIVLSTRFREGSVGVLVRADRSIAPHARSYEGIRGGRSFRHPVFARDGRARAWVSESTRPFLRPAAEQVGPQAIAEVRAVVDEALRTVGR